MESERWQEVKSIASRCLAIPAPGRRAAAERETAHDADLRAQVIGILAADEAMATGDFDGSAVERLTSPSNQTGRILGHYRLERLLGEGGMGAVYLGVRQDDFSLRAAVKILRPGYGPEARDRFIRERQILARLNHGYIARILDGGETGDGRLYLVIEFVDGPQLLDYAARGALTIGQRLELFIKVAQGVQYAHQNLVIHRDLKPGNILVDSDGNPRILDFGIAKLALDAEASGSPITSSVAPMTPEYASPEQLEGQPVTVASDVYSLGVILYELLSGRRPVRFPSRDWASMIRALREAKYAASGAGAELDSIAAKALATAVGERYQTAAELIADLGRYRRGEPLASMAGRAGYRLRKHAARHRWALLAGSAIAASLLGGLVATTRETRAAQLERARAEAFGKREEQQRNRAEQQAALARSRLVAIERESAAAQLARKREEIQRAKAEKRLADVRTLTQTFLFDIHERIRNLSGSLPAQEAVVATAARYLEELRRETGNDPGLLIELAEAYLRIGVIQGDGVSASFGRADEARKNFEIAMALASELESLRPGARPRRVILRSKQYLSALATNRQAPEAARELADDALARSRREWAQSPGDAEALSDLLRSFTYRGEVEYRQRAIPAALDWFGQGVAASAAGVARFPDSPRVLGNFASLRGMQATALGESGNLREAMSAQKHALELSRALAQLEPNNVAAKHNVAQNARLMGRWLITSGAAEESQAYLDEALRVSERNFAENPGDVRSKRDLGQSLTYAMNLRLEQSRLAEVLPLCRQRLRLARELAAGHPGNQVFANDVLVAEANLIDAHLESGDFELALEALPDAVSRARGLASKGSRYAEFELGNLGVRWMRAAAGLGSAVPDGALALRPPAAKTGQALAAAAQYDRWRAVALRKDGKPAEAAGILAGISEQLAAPGAALGEDLGLALLELARCRLATGERDAAAEAFARCIGMLEAAARAGSPRAKLSLSEALLAAGDANGAQRAAREAAERQPWNAEAHRLLAVSLAGASMPDGAARAQRQALERLPELPEGAKPGMRRRAWRADLERWESGAAPAPWN